MASSPSEPGPPPGSVLGYGCDWERLPEPCAIVIFGASGDLARRKLIPALYNLYLNQGLPDSFFVVGAARTSLTDDSFRERMVVGLKKAGMNLVGWEDFSHRLYYQPVGYDDPESFLSLKARLDELDRLHRTRSCRLFNLALPPFLYGVVARQLARAGLSLMDPDSGAWTRLVVEKPFGVDLTSARELNQDIRAGFREDQVFRIDHYLAKETVQNILMLRFANAIFEPLWNRNYIDHVRINASEALGVEHRAGYYEESGVLRDMFQNHMMQLLALVAAEPPSLFTADQVRDRKTDLFQSLRPLELDDLDQRLVLGQYGPGRVEGEPVPGYGEESGVDPESRIPTYALMKVYVDNWRWQGVPFYVTSGKRLKRKITRIDIQFKEVPHSMFRRVLGEGIGPNRLILGIQPKEEIYLNIQAKRPGPKVCLRMAGLQFSYHQDESEPKLDAYEKALADAMAGDQTLFWRQDGLELCWAFLDPILNSCEGCGEKEIELHPYPAGSDGPKAALDLLPPGSWPEKP